MSLDAGDIAYLHKLKQSKRDKKLISAYLLLLLALRRLRADAERLEIARDLAPTVGQLASGINRYVARQTHTATTSDRRKAIAVPLLAAIVLHAAKAQKLTQDERAQRLGVIARAELQNATVAATRRVAGTRTLTRVVHSGNPCERCEALAGTYDYPWPDEIFYTHPNCCCSWEIDQGEEVA